MQMVRIVTQSYGQKAQDFVYNNQSDVHEVERPSGNSNEAAHRRLRKDRPDLHALVLVGLFDPTAAADGQNILRD
jgi:hypothetical protein